MSAYDVAITPGTNDANLHASTAQLEDALRSAQEDSLPDLRGLLPLKVAATTPTPPPWVVSCKLCQCVVLASRFRYDAHYLDLLQAVYRLYPNT
eukprot:1175641-Prorocentrum_minimum.AAC.2